MSADSTYVNGYEPTDSPPIGMTGTPSTRGPQHWIMTTRNFIRAEQLVLAVLAATFLARLYLANWNSYWLDELYSVELYVMQPSSAIEAIRSLAETSVHPPLYQFILYYWVNWFGDSEVATRSLSNLYVTLSGLFLYLVVRDLTSRRIAIGSILAFVLMYTPTYYGLETRSYAQTILLATASSYFLVKMMLRANDHGWQGAVLSPAAAMFTLTNAALLLTHYYNIFFWLAQAALATLFVLRQRRIRQWARGVIALAGMYALQGVIFVVIWGSQFVDDLTGRADDYSLEGMARTPFDILRTSVVLPNIDAPRWVYLAGIVLLVVLLIRSIAILAQGKLLTAARREAWGVLYLFGWLLLPLVFIWIIFSMAGVARYSERYFVYSVVPLAPLVVLAVEEAFTWVRRIAEQGGRTLSTTWVTLATGVVLLSVLLPGGYNAATTTKHDLRGTAQTIVAIVESNPDASYAIYEPAFRRTPVLDYYLRRYSDEVRVTATIRRIEERRGEGFAFERTPELVDEHDFLIVPFTHHRTTNFPVALERLRERYHVHHWQIDYDNRGLVIFSVSGTGTDT